MTNSTDALICAAVRTPIGRFCGALSPVTAVELGRAAIAGALERAGNPVDFIDEVIMGCVLPAGLGQAPARQAALKAGIHVSVPAMTINKVCGSGLKSVMLASDSIALGRSQAVVAGGMESMSRAPFLSPSGRMGHKAGHTVFLDHMMFDGLEDAYETGRAMGTFGEDTAALYGVTRAEQDAYAHESVIRAQRAVREGAFAAEIVPVTAGGTSVGDDEIPGRIDVTKIPRLKPAFREGGTVTAASSSANGDAAAAVVVASRECALRQGMPVLARIRGHATHAMAPGQFTIAPIAAMRKLLAALSWNPGDVDLYEINEAFAVVVIAAMRELRIPHDRVNVNGGACALGHPIGASGTRVLVTLVHALRSRGLKRGVAALCIGGGEAVAMAVEVA